MTLFGNAYSKLPVLVTGHTGFKGSWLCLWLRELGAQVSGIARDPDSTPNHWNLLQLDVLDRRVDVRDFASLSQAIDSIRPAIVFHMAAQPLVRRSYRDPLETWSTNVMGTANVLEACRGTASVRAIVIITTDKCYENREWHWGYRESDQLGGHDPYSASKAAAELVAASYRTAFWGGSNGAPLLATARAGNVIGGGDWSEDRLIPDLVRALAAQQPLEIRSPQATRPWQHVLEPLSGYLALGQRLIEGNAQFAQAWNFGPDLEGNQSVREILEGLRAHWPQLEWRLGNSLHPHEAKLLYLDSSKARQELGWKPVWGLERTLAATADWYRDHYAGKALRTRGQIAEYIVNAREAGLPWAV